MGKYATPLRDTDPRATLPDQCYIAKHLEVSQTNPMTDPIINHGVTFWPKFGNIQISSGLKPIFKNHSLPLFLMMSGANPVKLIYKLDPFVIVNIFSGLKKQPGLQKE